MESIKFEKLTLDYKNGITCNVEKINGELKKYQFFSKDKKRLFLINNKESLILTHWSEYGKHRTSPDFKKLTFEELYNFNDFKDLISFGIGGRFGVYDGTMRDYNGNPISTLQIISKNSVNVYGGVKTLESAKKFKKKCDSISWILKSEIVKINRLSDTTENYSVNIYFLLGKKDWDKMLNETKSNYFSIDCTKWVINKVKTHNNTNKISAKISR